MQTVLGVILIVVFMVCVVGVAAATTWIVVKVSPSPKRPAESKPTSD